MKINNKTFLSLCAISLLDVYKRQTVITREEGSGTRGAFIELVGIEQDDVDRTIATADNTNRCV